MKSCLENTIFNSHSHVRIRSVKGLSQLRYVLYVYLGKYNSVQYYMEFIYDFFSTSKGQISVVF